MQVGRLSDSQIDWTVCWFRRNLKIAVETISKAKVSLALSVSRTFGRLWYLSFRNEPSRACELESFNLKVLLVALQALGAVRS